MTSAVMMRLYAGAANRHSRRRPVALPSTGRAGGENAVPNDRTPKGLSTGKPSHVYAFIIRGWNYSAVVNQVRFPRDRQNDINLALAEAWAWLEAQGLLVPALFPPHAKAAERFFTFLTANIRNKNIRRPCYKPRPTVFRMVRVQGTVFRGAASGTIS